MQLYSILICMGHLEICYIGWCPAFYIAIVNNVIDIFLKWCFYSVFIAVHVYFSNLPCSCSWNATYESLLGTNKRFYKPIPLSVSISISSFYVRKSWNLQAVIDYKIWLQLTGNGRIFGGDMGTRRLVWLSMTLVVPKHTTDFI